MQNLLLLLLCLLFRLVLSGTCLQFHVRTHHIQYVSAIFQHNTNNSILHWSGRLWLMTMSNGPQIKTLVHHCAKNTICLYHYYYYIQLVCRGYTVVTDVDKYLRHWIPSQIPEHHSVLDLHTHTHTDINRIIFIIYYFYTMGDFTFWLNIRWANSLSESSV